MNWKAKLTSRKFWAAIAGVAVGLAIAFGIDESSISVFSGAITALASVVSYIYNEGRIDAEAVAAAAEAAQKAKEALFADEETGRHFAEDSPGEEAAEHDTD